MKTRYSLFEKISMTLGVINGLLFMVGLCLGFIFGNERVGVYFLLPLGIQLVITMLLFILVEVIIYKIWGCDKHIFPSLFK